MFGRTAILLALALVLLTLSVPGAATADEWRGYPYCLWGGPLQLRSFYTGYYGYSTGYTLESVPYFVANPPVYLGYSSLIPGGPGFTTVSYGEVQTAPSPRVEPLVIINPYYKKEGGKANPAPKPAAPKATGSQPLTIPNPHLPR